jgi:hypothetical protein
MALCCRGRLLFSLIRRLFCPRRPRITSTLARLQRSLFTAVSDIWQEMASPAVTSPVD